MSKSTGPVRGRNQANNPGRNGGIGKTAPGPAQPAPANGRPDGVSRTGRKQGQATDFTPRPRRGKSSIG